MRGCDSQEQCGDGGDENWFHEHKLHRVAGAHACAKPAEAHSMKARSDQTTMRLAAPNFNDVYVAVYEP
jgi:hypothetical protein